MLDATDELKALKIKKLLDSTLSLEMGPPDYSRALLDSFPFMVWMKDLDGRFIAANHKFAEVAKADSPFDLLGKTDFDLWPEDLAQGYVDDDASVLEAGQSKTMVEKIIGSDGDRYWAETYKAPVLIGSEVIGTVGYAYDLTERTNLVSEITKKELEYNNLGDNLPMQIIKYDLEARRTYINAGYDQTRLGTTPLECWPQNFSVTAQEYYDITMSVINTGKSEKFEVEQLDEDGNFELNILIHIIPEFDAKKNIVGALSYISDITEMVQHRQKMEHLAFHDTLTGLPNRALLNKQLQSSTASNLSLFFIDLDYFKTINDTLGHSVGDELLAEAAKRISAGVGDASHTVARIGGDEFAILVNEPQDKVALQALANKIKTELSEPYNISGRACFLTASVGIASYPTDSDSIDDLMKYADTAMYQAKKKGRNKCEFYRSELMEKVIERLDIATELRSAIQQDELQLLFQPKVEITTQKVLGAEALLRWHSNALGFIPPDKFIPIAEETGVIVDIGAWVFRKTCEAAVQINQGKEQPLKFAFNVSTREFVGSGYFNRLLTILEETNCDPKWLTLEVTESLLLHDSDVVLDALERVVAAGMQVSMDDFGTGYSALAYLNKFPIQQVKIDRSFVMDICTNENAATLVKAIIAMSIGLNKDLVAEGIETQEQAALIRGFGCRKAQGYLYSKPIPLEDFSKLGEQIEIN